ncbi:RNA 2',3'-cyclic phosphodiesterase [Aurantiacibacter gangjinensis]|uniref:RNA 2',3'-cyclic phosphodiesterase n=1 Tax=Aurantiacibacter gangjinensis TaxID=502682 RepID=A0A0G9MPD9_9SPHN|nr:RNA 2',3'-cyclic phosphodiesterase [Aurantiacibacter gangjinensis]APE28372.1 2'-5' RNA ligase [Aurantiacibacter gangjinensis]KLE32601.1 hypothetical protein AAW01_00585 [Aurantiacibacter gangjinensis]
MTRRLFVALGLPDRVSEPLLDAMEGVPGARWQDADNLHITLRFIGEVDRHLEADIVAALSSIAFLPLEVRLSGVGHFEGAKRARAIWAAVEPNGELDLLQMRVEMACRRAGCAPVTRKFVPHVTLARLSAGSGPLESWLHANGKLAPPAWTARSFSLFESDLTPNGPIYTEIQQFP